MRMRCGVARRCVPTKERYPQVFGAALVRLRDAQSEEELRSVETDLRRQATALGVTVDSILATSTFRSRSQAATP